MLEIVLMKHVSVKAANFDAVAPATCSRGEYTSWDRLADGHSACTFERKLFVGTFEGKRFCGDLEAESSQKATLSPMIWLWLCLEPWKRGEKVAYQTL